MSKWVSYTAELLARIFDDQIIYEEFEQSTYRPASALLKEYNLNDELEYYYSDIKRYLLNLEDLFERLDLIPDIQAGHDSVEQIESPSISKKIFIVHGHDNEAKETAARYCDKLGLTSVILHEQASGGKTVIEKLERHADVGFAIVLLTPDDIGYPKGASEQAMPRARQNVILELGYFLGLLGRQRVIALTREGVEMPSDYQGVIYIPMDAAGAWRLLLAREIKEAGIDIDLNKAIL
ncbi:TIR domain-containing protein [Brevibacillus laterosporus]|uniref:TIR domain-containing protein n=1 Tax=Brevibacillus laterosporus TaxID=1465 RepID=UPI001EF320F6|nr:nucleotide-binding protein [Brevibacillus laterosporus]MCG7320173.1 nucleotide-binding protein [Brevibacillus laterosporus]